MSQTIVYIHGANATENSFNYIRYHIDSHEIMLNYDSETNFAYNLDKMKERLLGEDRITFIAHSLGGIYALYLANHFSEKTIQGITMSTPYGGSEAAVWLKYIMPHKPLFRDISSNGPIIRKAADFIITKPWCNIVSISGDNSWILMSNDGVVSLDSMKSRHDIDIIELRVNHYEIVVHPKTIEIIRQRLVKYNYRF